MQTHAERFREMMRAWSLTQEELGTLCGLKRGTVGTIVNGKTSPDVEALATLKRNKPELNWDWLLLGTGPMLRDGRALVPLDVTAPVARPLELSQDEHRRELVASAENVLLRQIIAGKDELISELRGKPSDNSDAAGLADPTPPPPAPRAAAGFRMTWQARRREQKRAAGLS